MNKILFKREIKSNYKLIVIFMAVLTVYSAMIITMFDPKLGESLKTMAESMPEIFAAFGMLDGGNTLIEFLVNYLYGFLFVVFPLVFIIFIANRVMARYVDRGSMVYLLTTGNKRSKIARTQAIFMIVSILCLVIYVTILCIVMSEILFCGELEIDKFLLVNVGLYGLLLFLGGICFCASSIFNDTKFSYGVSAGITIAFILIQMISQVGEKFQNLKYATPLTLFNTDGLMKGEINAILQFTFLYIMGILFYIIGIKKFSKRDLPI